MLRYFIYCRMAEGKSFRNVNGVSIVGSRNEEMNRETFFA